MIKMNVIRIIVAMTAILVSGMAKAQNFIDTSIPEDLFNIGFRVGVNTSNRTFNRDYFREWNIDGWGTGFDLGCVVDLNMRDFFSLQPGLFFQSRSGNYSYAQDYFNGSLTSERNVQLGRYRNYHIVIPVMASFRFNVVGGVRWIVEAGPYVQYRFKSADDDDIVDVVFPQDSPNDRFLFSSATPRRGDYGIKMGTGLLFNRCVSINVHYMAGMREAWNVPFKGGHKKAWCFTIGYEL